MWTQFLNFMNSCSALWNPLVAIATIGYVFLTYKLIKETITTRNIQNQPFVIVDFELKMLSLNLIIKNTGNSPARDIRINIEPDIKNPFSNIKFLAPNRELTSTVMYVFDFDNKKQKSTKYKISIRYTDIYKHPTIFSQEYEIDIAPFLQSINFDEEEFKNMIVEFYRMSSKYDRLRDDFKGISEMQKKV